MFFVALSARARYGITALMLLVLGLFWWYVLYTPLAQKVGQHRARHSAQQADQQQYVQFGSTKKKLHDSIAHLEKTVHSYNNDHLLTSVLELVRTAGLTLQMCTVDAVQLEGSFTRESISLECIGSLQNLTTFLSSIEKSHLLAECVVLDCVRTQKAEFNSTLRLSLYTPKN